MLLTPAPMCAFYFFADSDADFAHHFRHIEAMPRPFLRFALRPYEAAHSKVFTTRRAVLRAALMPITRAGRSATPRAEADDDGFRDGLLATRIF